MIGFRSMQMVLSVLLVTLGLGQIISTGKGWRAASLVGPSRPVGLGLGMLLLIIGSLNLPLTWPALWWPLLTGPLALALLLVGGSFVFPPPNPNLLFSPHHPAHASCQPVQIPDGEYIMPGFLLSPPRFKTSESVSSPSSRFEEGIKKGLAVCVVPGAGDHKSFFKWRLVQTLLSAGFTVLTIDTPGHGDYRQRPMRYPDCLSAVPAALRFLQKQPGITHIGVVGISLGGALAVRSMVENWPDQGNRCRPPEALVVLETPVQLNYSRRLFFREAWRACRAPVLSLLQEISVRQMIQGWRTGGYRSAHSSTAELIALLDPVKSIDRLKETPLLLVYSDCDPIAPPTAAGAMEKAAPQADLLISKKASHVTLTLLPEINRQVACWLRAQVGEGGGRSK
jgi:pimeloyl-ACP methyl ester carboxylesterase